MYLSGVSNKKGPHKLTKEERCKMTIESPVERPLKRQSYTPEIETVHVTV
jgi:hypothetical protein